MRLQVIGDRLRGEIIAGLIPVRIGILIQLALLDALFPEGGRQIEKLDLVITREVSQQFFLRVVILVELVVDSGTSAPTQSGRDRPRSTLR